MPGYDCQIAPPQFLDVIGRVTMKVAAKRDALEKAHWLNRNIWLPSFFSDAVHEMATVILWLFLITINARNYHGNTYYSSALLNRYPGDGVRLGIECLNCL